MTLYAIKTHVWAVMCYALHKDHREGVFEYTQHGVLFLGIYFFILGPKLGCFLSIFSVKKLQEKQNIATMFKKLNILLLGQNLANRRLLRLTNPTYCV